MAAGIVLLLAMTSGSAHAQKPPIRQANPGDRSSEFLPAVLIREAGEADSLAGNQRFAAHLAELFLTGGTGDAYTQQFSERLSKADLHARHQGTGWVSESIIVRAFDDLIRNISGPEPRRTPLPHTSKKVVHQLRMTLVDIAPEFSTVRSHPDECLPTEAVNLMIQLLLHNGKTEGPCPPAPGPDGVVANRACADVEAVGLMYEYSNSQSSYEQKKLFDHTAALFGL